MASQRITVSVRSPPARYFVSLLLAILLAPYAGAAASPEPPERGTGHRQLFATRRGHGGPPFRLGRQRHAARAKIQTAYQVIVTADQTNAGGCNQCFAVGQRQGPVGRSNTELSMPEPLSPGRPDTAGKCGPGTRRTQVSPWSAVNSFVTSFLQARAMWTPRAGFNTRRPRPKVPGRCRCSARRSSFPSRSRHALPVYLRPRAIRILPQRNENRRPRNRPRLDGLRQNREIT